VAMSAGSANLEVEGRKYQITCNQVTEMGLPKSGNNKVFIQVGGIRKALKAVLVSNILHMLVPVVKDAEITIE